MNVLITNFEIKQYSGSEINAVTIGKRFKEMGYTVYIAALDFGNPLLSDIQNSSFDYLINILDGEFDFNNIVFDIVWAHHSFILDWLIFDKNVKARKIINSSLSPVEVFEVPPIYANDISLSIANSMETLNVLKAYNISNTYLLENYSFKKYFENNNKVSKLRRIAVVSNHVPEEIFDAIKLLDSNGYEVQIYGIEGKKELITDKILMNYDLVISIGKTVQYAMSLSIPIYIYDKFGGPGYLTMDNIGKNRAHNFSGRGFQKKTSITIYNEIITLFDKCLTQLNEIKEYSRINFCFEDKIDDILNILDGLEDVDLSIIRKKYKHISRNIICSKKIAEYLQRRNVSNVITIQNNNKTITEQQKSILQKDQCIQKLNNEIFIQSKEIEKLEEINIMQTTELNAIKTSKAWKVITMFRKIIYFWKK